MMMSNAMMLRTGRVSGGKADMRSDSRIMVRKGRAYATGMAFLKSA